MDSFMPKLFLVRELTRNGLVPLPGGFFHGNDAADAIKVAAVKTGRNAGVFLSEEVSDFKEDLDTDLAQIIPDEDGKPCYGCCFPVECLDDLLDSMKTGI